MDEYMESELSGIFRVKLVTKYIVRGSPGTQFMHMRVKRYHWLIQKPVRHQIKSFFTNSQFLIYTCYIRVASKLIVYKMNFILKDFPHALRVASTDCFKSTLSHKKWIFLKK